MTLKINNNTAYITYIIYIIFWTTLVWFGLGYVVFLLDYSGWWFLFGILLSGCTYSPKEWINRIED